MLTTFLFVFLGIGVFLSGHFLFLPKPKTYWPNSLKFQRRTTRHDVKVLIDKSVPFVNNEVYIKDFEIAPHVLTKMCVLAIEAVESTFNRNKEKIQPRNSEKLQEVVFVFLEKERFERVIVGRGLHKDSKGFSVRLGNKKLAKLTPGTFCVVTCIDYLEDFVTAGEIVIHELIHIYSRNVGIGWDQMHKLWKTKDNNGRNLEEQAREKFLSLKNLPS